MCEKRIIQKIVFSGNYSQPTELYYRGDAKKDNKKLIMRKNSSISFDTYFNMFSYAKMSRYCNIPGLEYRILAEGKYYISIYGKKGNKTKLLLNKASLDELTVKEMSIPLHDKMCEDMDFIYLTITACSNCVISSINLYADLINRNELRVACGICTYKREQMLLRNISRITQDILLNTESILHNRLDIYISNNGGTIDKLLTGEYANPRIKVFSNPNYGGAAGFTRCLIEAVIKSPKKYDYIILMDDDALIEPYVLEKTFFLLSILKEEYNEFTIAGALLDALRMNIQVENGAVFTIKKPIKIKNGFNLLEHEYLILNEEESDNTKPNYSCWYYSCIPTNTVRKEGLPLPLFIHGDDQEFGIRNCKGIITMNGIGIWHPNPDSVIRPYMAYYDARNSLIINAEFCPELFILDALKLVARYVWVSLVLYRYEACLNALKGVEDFYSGIDYFKTIKPEELHRQVISTLKYRVVDVDEDIKLQEKNKSSQSSRIIKRLLNWILPATKSALYYDVNTDTQGIDVFRRKAIFIVNKDSKTAYEFKKDYEQFFTVILKLLKTERIVAKNHKKVWNEWNKRIVELTSIDYWREYLGIEDVSNL